MLERFFSPRSRLRCSPHVANSCYNLVICRKLSRVPWVDLKKIKGRLSRSSGENTKTQNLPKFYFFSIGALRRKYKSFKSRQIYSPDLVCPIQLCKLGLGRHENEE